MRNERFNIFTNRREVFALFQRLYERNPKAEQQQLPILLLQAPGGGGISMVIDLLMERSSTVLSHAYLDFAQIGTPATIYEMLQNLCDQIRQSGIPSTPPPTFPRSELGLSAILDQVTENNATELRRDMQRRAAKSLPLYEQLNDLINATANWLLPIALIIVLFKWLLKILEKTSPFRELLWGSTLRWYRQQGYKLRLSSTAEMADILVLMRRWSRPTETRQRQLIVEKLLFDAFLEDLDETFNKKRTKIAQGRTSHIVFFLDNFDVSLTGGVGDKFLRMLINSRINGRRDPLLVIIGSHQRLFDTTDPMQNPPFERQERADTSQSGEEHVQMLLAQWEQRFHKEKSQPELCFCLPVWLHAFRPSETASYLLRAIGQGRLSAFEFVVMAEDIQRITHGYPLALALVAEVLQQVRMRGRKIAIHEVMQEPVLSHALEAPDHEQKTIGTHILSVLLHQLTEKEQEQLVYCCVPRRLTIGTLQVILGLNSEKEARDIWTRYSKFNVIRVIDQQTLLLHPLARDLLMQRLMTMSNPGRDYYKALNSNLRDYFAELAATEKNPEQIQNAQIEEAYHALALGNTEPAISYICSMLERGDEKWSTALKTMTQAPTTHITQQTKKRASQALYQAKLRRQIKDAIEALLLYSWILEDASISIDEKINVWYELSETYRYIPGLKREESQKIARAFFEKAQAAVSEDLSLLKEVETDIRIPTTPFPVKKISKVWRNLRLIAAAFLLTATVVPYLYLYYGHYIKTFCSPDDILSPLKVISSAYFSPSLRITHAPDEECIGISDGSFAFDVATNPASGLYKTQAANYLAKGDKDNAKTYWEKARTEDPTDAETLIYMENQNVLKLAESREHFPYVTIVILTMLTSSPQHRGAVATGRDDLRGAYIAQLQQNSTFQTPLLRILIANAGDSSQYAIPVAKQIIQAVQEDKTIVGVVGPAQSRDETAEAVRMLGRAHIPTLSATASSDTFTGISPFFFRTSPTNTDQVNLGVQYAETRLGAETAVLFEDPTDNYSRTLSAAFIKRFQDQDHHRIFKIEHYNAKDAGNVSNTIAAAINNACTYDPDLIYFTGRADDMVTLLNTMPSCGKENETKIIAADELDQIISEPGGKFPLSASNRVYYTSFASPYAWDNVKQPPPLPRLFFDSYRRVFASNRLPASAQPMLPNGHLILAHDALYTFLYAVTNTVTRTKNLYNLDEIQKSFSAIHGEKALQGVSGVIDFGTNPNGDPINKAIVVLGVDERGDAHLVETLNRLQKGVDPS
jgi:ABC-type branched-subunit amino acid transport system substrate-binding protein